MGEADAAFLYRSDVLGMPGIQVIEVPPEFRPSIAYSVGKVGTHEGDADVFMTFVQSSTAQAVFAGLGFEVVR